MLVSILDARKSLFAALPGTRTESVPLSLAAGRYLASDLASGEDVPPADRSTMDGFAVRASDTVRAPVDLRIVGEVAAGSEGAPIVGPGTCARIFTGANVPPGADAIAIVERTEPAGAAVVRLLEPVARGENVRTRGEDCSSGVKVLSAGTRLGPQHMAVCAAVGADPVPVFAIPRVGVLVTGAEIRRSSDRVGVHETRNSNGPAVLAALRDLGMGHPVDLGVADDVMEDLVAHLERGLEACDALIVTGGVSMGDRDLVPGAVDLVGGRIVLRRVRMKPGKPFLFATAGGGEARVRASREPGERDGLLLGVRGPGAALDDGASRGRAVVRPRTTVGGCYCPRRSNPAPALETGGGCRREHDGPAGPDPEQRGPPLDEQGERRGRARARARPVRRRQHGGGASVEPAMVGGRPDREDGSGLRQVDRLRLSVTDACDLGCSYCMPAGGPSKRRDGRALTMAEKAWIAKVLVERCGIRSVRLTGGEPLVATGLPDLVGALARLGLDDLAITTNGQRLERAARDLAGRGLRRVNVSLDSLDPATYRGITGSGDLARTIEGIDAALDAGLVPVKINTVVMRGINDGELVDLACFGLARGCEVRFLELMPVGVVRFAHPRLFVPRDEMMRSLRERLDLDPVAGERGSTARVFEARGPGGLRGRVGMVSPQSAPFCESCGRLRLSAGGQLLGCLHAASGVDVLPAVRSAGGPDEASLVGLFREAVSLKPASRCGSRLEPMHAIGG